MDETFEFLRTQSEEIMKPYLSGQSPGPPLNERWLRGLRTDDVIETDRETLIVVDDMHNPVLKKPKLVRVMVKRPHLKCPVLLKSCNEFEDCVEIIWSIGDGYKQCEFNKWKVKREGIEINPEVLYNLSVELENAP